MKLNLEIEVYMDEMGSLGFKINDGRFVIQHSHYLDSRELIRDLQDVIGTKVKHAYITERNKS